MGDLIVGTNRQGRVQKRRPSGRAFSAAQRKRFLTHLAETANVTAAVGKSGVSSSTVYRTRYREPEFAAEWDRALAIGYDRLEAAMLAAAMKAVRAAEDSVPVPEGEAVIVSFDQAQRLLNHHRSLAREGRWRGHPDRDYAASAERTDAAILKLLKKLPARRADPLVETGG
ncbi:hypothetical protein NYR55_10875 [Sphingomonas sp. BGYR3]|uniref:hypothetical protein n=1 Tax=Sphingomonas sp. BGYR3 TaxID=2975483 RepID=UPI0021A6C30B|nr:hypothetical protein [Sphingomonas sp. BGYR3]MDG5489116.1 hypothetical protein [Sphingomonas sp. BGYR3]